MPRNKLLSGPQIILGGLSVACGWLALALLGLFIGYNAGDFILAIADAVLEAGK